MGFTTEFTYNIIKEYGSTATNIEDKNNYKHK